MRDTLCSASAEGRYAFPTGEKPNDPRLRRSASPTLVRATARTIKVIRAELSNAGVVRQGPYRKELMICRYASSGNAFSDVVRTLPSLPSNKRKRAATASSGAS